MAAPRGERLIITLLGRRNVGKSSLINGITGQEISIVSDTPGTTTDPVAKHYELIPVGPVTFYDTAGIDDIGELGEQRVRATRKVLWRSDIVLLVFDKPEWDEHDRSTLKELQEMEVPFLVVFNKADLYTPDTGPLTELQRLKIPYSVVTAQNSGDMLALRKQIIALVPEYFKREKPIIGDIIQSGDAVLCIVPIDLSAPKGRIILPQVQVIRDILDHNGVAITVKETEIGTVLSQLKKKPALVITDSQAVLQAAKEVPEDIPFTTFSTAFARYKADLAVLLEGLRQLDKLEDGDRVLISEACSHHVECDDIGRYKIPRWIEQYLSKKIRFDIASGHDYPDDLTPYKLIIHCGGCMITGLEFMRRLRQAQAQGVPITNYGILISKTQGLLERVIRPFGF
ncbi:MAG: [FeFe] hydrogenase H-cluster maturation GTPase HydF [Candidatus Marinimicrobia bacterium]|jgi:[FeFe] hydrogenase H-cluster maturation GTPase HydF|nr:[FeFe] hydrogenase H-cluster maturation GTPase HydF [Candidatus Neomarinimicrobiota bacterium]MDD4962269.1 [FeFe] hydrogenase H-cluster maturation GTPase HydF [Candidatus Neomarinimicrobiota bacterium]MDD5710366.1 [FeFe] hydrogenase H-cluster maturation GTPase HydF [Candidatus Neomarinimicrobiota bacterium]MDX9778621.1 [FeFe] hydrogenase H-cluster maturation GTPase HydF [bacterium]